MTDHSTDHYAKAGVDIEAGYQSVKRIKKHIEKTSRPEVLSGLGGFGGVFDISQFSYSEPVLVSGTDGVGTKLALADHLGVHNTIGIDLVAMCVNDVIAQGALPLFFLDYIASGKTDPHKVESIVEGISQGCIEAGCALIGGETAEMPGLYSGADYDIAGFTVGIVNKPDVITGRNITEGDILIGLNSSGVHSNGFSLVRSVFSSNDSLDIDPESQVAQELMKPTRIYVSAIKNAMKVATIKGISHITGGGFIENVPRMLPEGLGANINRNSWEVPEIFHTIQERGGISDTEMVNVFNMGIGMVLAVDSEDQETVLESLLLSGETPHVIGQVIKGQGVQFD